MDRLRVSAYAKTASMAATAVVSDSKLALDVLARRRILSFIRELNREREVASCSSKLPRKPT